MPIGIGLGAAALGAGASIYSSSQAAKAQKKAANKAAETQAQAATTTSNMALQLADKNNAFAQSMYDQNEGHLNPFINIGTTAGNDIMELLLGKPPATPPTAPTWGNPTGTPPPPPVSATPTPAAPPVPVSNYHGPSLSGISSQGQMDAYMGYYQAHPEEDPGFTSIAQFHGDPYKDEDSANAVLAAHNAYAASHPATPTPTPAPAPGTPPATPPGTTPAPGTPPATTPASPNAAQDAWDTFRNSTNYQWRLDQGLDATGTKYAAGGAFESGAEKIAINNYAQNFASNELANYMDQLYRQEALGASAASSLAGVGTNLVSQVSANNNNAANVAINGVNNAAAANGNAALIAGQGSANNWANAGNAVGQVAGAIGGAFGSSYGGGYDYGALQDSGIYDGAGWNF